MAFVFCLEIQDIAQKITEKDIRTNIWDLQLLNWTEIEGYFVQLSYI